VSAFVLFAALNYLDRQLLAAVAPALKAEFAITNAQYGWILSAFSLTYLIVTPFAGLLVDRVGLGFVAVIAVSAWSGAGFATGLVASFGGLAAARMALGLAEASGIPCSSKSNATYLHPRELALGDAVLAVGITIGAIAAPLLTAAIEPRFGWRAVFVICGAAGFLWIPLWRAVSKGAPAAGAHRPSLRKLSLDVLADRRLWIVLAANVLIMTVYSLWMNWTTIYFVQQWHLTQLEANRYFAWIPPIFGTVGGFIGGAWGLSIIRRGGGIVETRLRICRRAAPILLATAVTPLLPSTAWAAAGISLSFLGCMMILTSLHVIPIDLFGRGRAAFTAALLASSYALTQTVLSPAIGGLIERIGFDAVLFFIPVLPFTGVALLSLLPRIGPTASPSEP
jgi:ACS family hexuronate transporter-like MFS transporter